MKKLVIYFDGTSAKFGNKNTNVVKAYRVTSSSNQVKCYIPGVGSLSDKKHYFITKRIFKQLLGLAFGYGLQEKVLEGYKFLSENYQEGDEIYLFGFSRGAYAAKVLAGMMELCGLIDKHNIYNIQYAYNLYSARKPDFKVMARFKKTFSKFSPSIKFIGLWDSVSSVGNIVQMRNLPHTSNIKNVEILRHAIAVNEKRFMFVNNTSHSKGDNIQMWFPGEHSDVGGGQIEEESQLSKIPLKWMLSEAKNHGLKLNQSDYERYVDGKNDNYYTGPSYNGKTHKSSRLWYILNFIPRFKKIRYNPSEYDYFIPLLKYREIKQTDDVHQSVFDRMKEHENYKPKNVIRWQDTRNV